jgi:hypothetical protein
MHGIQRRLFSFSHSGLIRVEPLQRGTTFMTHVGWDERVSVSPFPTDIGNGIWDMVMRMWSWIDAALHSKHG